MFSFLLEPFIQNAIIVGLLLGASAALLSPFLVLSNQSMIADGLSHVAFSAIIFGLLLYDEPIFIAIPFTIMGSLLITYLGERKMINQDASIGVVSSFFLSIGFITISLSSGFNQSIESLLRGSILSVSKNDIWFSLILLIVILIFILLNYRKLLSITFDLTFAKVSKIKYNLIKYILSAITATFIVIGVKSVGMLLISAFLIFPTLIASQFSKSFKSTILLSVISAIFVIFIAFIPAYHLNIPTSSAIVVLYTIVLGLSLIFKSVKS